MNKLITTILLLTTLTSLSQTDTGKQRKWKIGLTFSPDIYFNSTSISTSEYTGYYINPSRFNFTTGLTGHLTIIPKLDIGTGIAYSRKDYSGTPYCHVCGLVIPPQLEPIKQRYLEIPIFVRYHILDKKLDLHVETGLTGGYLTNEIDTKYEGMLSINKLLLSGQLGLGFDLDLGQRINLSWTTTYRQALTNFSNDTNFKLRSFGFVTGVAYRIQNSKNGG